MVRSHADLDSLSHSLQDALSKDALHCVDKEWWGAFQRVGAVKTKARESVTITITYSRKGA